MTYIDAILVKEKNSIEVVERVAGKRVFKSYPSRYVMYSPNEKGKYTSIFGTKLTKYETTRAEEFQRECRMIPREKQFESDVNPIFRCFYDHYKDAPSPKLNVGFFDIETALNTETGYSSPEDALNPVTAISMYCNWLDKCFCLVLKPDTLTVEEAQDIVNRFDDTLLCNDEEELLDLWLTLIEDADILTGWNSESYDIPYLYNRIIRVLGKEHTKRMCLWNKYPKKREYQSYGRDAVTYDLVGRVHLDYLALYRKHTYHEMHTYRLDYVGEVEVGEKKVAYDGSLDALYNQDFEKFIAYSIQDVMLLVKIDAKPSIQFINLSNELAHANGILFATTLGSVQMIDNAIAREANDMGLQVPTKLRMNPDAIELDSDGDVVENNGIAGAYVANPVKGMHSWIGAMDINSLYPSVIRALNMSKETIIGQIRLEQTDKLIKKRMTQEKKTFAEAWNDTFHVIEYGSVMNKDLTSMMVDFENGDSVEFTGEELNRFIFENPKKPMALSANGTIVDLGKEGIVPTVLAKWYSTRKSMQAEAKKFYGMADKETDPNEKIALKKQGDYYDKRQLIEKIKLNSAYGSLSNPASKWYNSMIGQSTTLSGRMIVRHMGAKINEIITGDYNYLGKSIIYGDSVTGDTLIRTDGGEITIEQLYKESVEHCIADGKEYGLWSQAKVIGFNAHDMEPVISQIEYVMRHKTKKKLYRITTENGKQITVTEDHSVMIDRDGFLIEVKPTDIQASDGIITLRSLEAEWTVISTIENLGEVDDYVYDISIKNGDPMFFGNDILVHNTDSQYFSAYPTMKDDPEFADFGWAKEDIITLYDQIADLTNESFPEFMKKSFNVPLKRGEVIRAGREICASRGLFITKKRYAVMIFDKEGKRKDVDGKSGEIKAMGLDLKRSDTNLKVQKFLMDVLVAVLHDKSQDEIFDIIKSFRKEIKENWMPWEYGTPKRVNNMSKFLAITQRATKVDVFGGGDKGKKSMIPGHVLAALSWNRLRDIHHDNEAMKIQDGQKTVVCRLRNNPYGFTAIAYPIDQLILPEWFTTLPFDTDLMEEKIVDNKIGNLLDVLEWDLTKSKINGVFDELFTF